MKLTTVLVLAFIALCACEDINIFARANGPNGALRAERMIRAIWSERLGTFQLGDVAHVSKFKRGDMIWWPEGMDKLRARRIDHYNVTSQISSGCCVGITVSYPPACHAELCCGGGCCC